MKPLHWTDFSSENLEPDDWRYYTLSVLQSVSELDY